MDVFFFQAEDGIRDRNVTGVQTCALPIFAYGRANGGPARRGTDPRRRRTAARSDRDAAARRRRERDGAQIGRASCRERVERSGVAAEVTTSGTAERARCAAANRACCCPYT